MDTNEPSPGLERRERRARRPTTPPRNELNRGDWLRAARRALLAGGAEAVRVAKLARDLGVTKGSFYWHFRDRDEILDLLLAEWEAEMPEMVARLDRPGAGAGFAALIREVVERARLSEQGEAPSDAAIFAWASVSPQVAARVNRCEEERIRLLSHLLPVNDPNQIEVLYLAWLGFVARGQRLPAMRQRFPVIARAMLELIKPRHDATGERTDE